MRELVLSQSFKSTELDKDTTFVHLKTVDLSLILLIYRW